MRSQAMHPGRFNFMHPGNYLGYPLFEQFVVKLIKGIIQLRVLLEIVKQWDHPRVQSTVHLVRYLGWLC